MGKSGAFSNALYYHCTSFVNYFNPWIFKKLIFVVIVLYEDITVSFLTGIKILLYSKTYKPALLYSYSCCQQAPGVISPGIKRLGVEADHSLSSGAMVKNEWSYASTSLYAFISRRGTNLTLPLRVWSAAK